MLNTFYFFIIVCFIILFMIILLFAFNFNHFHCFFISQLIKIPEVIDQQSYKQVPVILYKNKNFFELARICSNSETGGRRPLKRWHSSIDFNSSQLFPLH